MLGGVLSADMVRYSHGDICFPCRARAHVQRGIGEGEWSSPAAGRRVCGPPPEVTVRSTAEEEACACSAASARTRPQSMRTASGRP